MCSDINKKWCKVGGLSVEDQSMNNHLLKEDEEFVLNLDVKAEICFSRKGHPEGKMVPISIDGKEEFVLMPLDIKDGDTIKVNGRGKFNPSSGKTGDLYILVHIEEKKVAWKVLLIPILAVTAIVIALFLFRKPSSSPQPTTEPTISTSCNHVWIPANCVAPETCRICGETRGPVMNHQWTEATYDAPKTCSNCGKTEGTAIGYPLTWCTEIENSNNPNAVTSVDISVGTWRDVFGTQYADSIRYWVSASLVANEYSVYDINSNYTKLALTVVNADNNADNGENQVIIYADNKIIYRSDWIRNDSPAVEKTLDITGVKHLKIECCTNSRKNCYCLVSGLLYK